MPQRRPRPQQPSCPVYPRCALPAALTEVSRPSEATFLNMEDLLALLRKMPLDVKETQRSC